MEALGVNHLISWPNEEYRAAPTPLDIVRRAEPRRHASRIYFDGRTYEPEFDEKRLGEQHRAVWNIVRDAEWRTLDEIISAIVANGGKEYATAAISARVRDFRKPRFGGYMVDIRARGDRRNGLFEYRVRRAEPVTARISEA